MYLFDSDQERNKKAAKRLLRNADDVIRLDEISYIFRSVCYIADRDADLANEIFPGAGDCFHPFEIGSLIRADMSDADANVLLFNRKIELERFRHLIVPFISMFNVSESEVVNLASAAYDCIHQLDFVKRQDRKDRNLRMTLKSMDKCRILIGQIIPLIKNIHYEIWGNFGDYRSAFRKMIYNEDRPADTTESVCRDLELLSACINFEFERQRHGVSEMRVGNNGEKQSIVEAAYEICKNFGGPRFVTTPNSEFARLCGLLYELASGREEESFAGAIAIFAKSPEKVRIDEAKQELNRDELLQQIDNSNFIEVSEEAGRDLRLANSQLEFLKLLESETPAYALCFIMVTELTRSAQEKLNRYGPNLVYASRISPRDIEKMSSKHTEGFERLRALEIELGRVRRQSNAHLGERKG